MRALVRIKVAQGDQIKSTYKAPMFLLQVPHQS